GWSRDGQQIYFACAAGQPFARLTKLFAVPLDGGLPRELPLGRARHITHGPRGAVAIGRHTREPARWKRYRGGTRGQIWIDPQGDGMFARILEALPGNLTSPAWVGNRLYFISDHEGIGNL